MYIQATESNDADTCKVLEFSRKIPTISKLESSVYQHDFGGEYADNSEVLTFFYYDSDFWH